MISQVPVKKSFGVDREITWNANPKKRMKNRMLSCTIIKGFLILEI